MTEQSEEIGQVEYEDWHVCRSWSPPDPFAPECGCDLLPCGHVDGAKAGDCEQHSVAAMRTIRSAHRPRFCPTTGGVRASLSGSKEGDRG